MTPTQKLKFQRDEELRLKYHQSKPDHSDLLAIAIACLVIVIYVLHKFN